jgi:hypothetical protein
MRDKHCCESFKDFIPFFYWMNYCDDDKIIYIMPYHDVNDDYKLRVNHCPSCGAEIRDIELTKI